MVPLNTSANLNQLQQQTQQQPHQQTQHQTNTNNDSQISSPDISESLEQIKVSNLKNINNNSIDNNKDEKPKNILLKIPSSIDSEQLSVSYIIILYVYIATTLIYI